MGEPFKFCVFQTEHNIKSDKMRTKTSCRIHVNFVCRYNGAALAPMFIYFISCAKVDLLYILRNLLCFGFGRVDAKKIGKQ